MAGGLSAAGEGGFAKELNAFAGQAGGGGKAKEMVVGARLRGKDGGPNHPLDKSDCVAPKEIPWGYPSRRSPREIPR